MIKILTRKVLYDRVWDRPVTKVAAEFGISDVALHKICRKHRISTPTVGYWAKVAAGKPVKKTSLSVITKPGLEHVRIRRGNRQSASVREAKEQSQALSSLSGNNKTTSGSANTATSPFIRQLRKRVQKPRTRRDGFIRVAGKRQFNIEVTPATVERTIDILDSVVSESLTRGYTLKPSDNCLVLLINGELIGFRLRELLERKPHEITNSEKRKTDRWEAEKKRKKKLGQWYGDWDKPKIPEYDHVPEGRLSFEFIDGSYQYGTRSRFADGKRLAVQTLNRTQQKLDLFLIDASDGSVRHLLRETDEGWVKANEDMCFLKKQDRFLWVSERDGYAHLYLYDLDGKLVNRVTSGEWAIRASTRVFWHNKAVAHIDEDEGWVYFTALEKSSIEKQLYRVRLDGSGMERLTGDDGTHRIAFRGDGKYYLDELSTIDKMPSLTLRRPERDEGRLIAEPRPDLLKPRHFDPSKRYPVVIYVYGGPSAPAVSNAWGGRAAGLLRADTGRPRDHFAESGQP